MIELHVVIFASNKGTLFIRNRVDPSRRCCILIDIQDMHVLHRHVTLIRTTKENRIEKRRSGFVGFYFKPAPPSMVRSWSKLNTMDIKTTFYKFQKIRIQVNVFQTELKIFPGSAICHLAFWRYESSLAENVSNRPIT